MAVLGVELARRDRESFDWWYPQHLAELAAVVDQLYVRVHPPDEEAIRAHLEASPLAGRYAVEPQALEQFGRFQEDHERQQLLGWAAAQRRAEWVTCFDADEAIEPGGGAALRDFLRSPRAAQARLIRMVLSYSSHHRPGWVLPRGLIKPWRVFRLDRRALRYRYQADRDGLHCGSVPNPGVGSLTLPDLRVLHYHATSCSEYMEERRFYDNTSEVEKHGGIDYLYRCDRFGSEDEAVPLEQELSGADERLARVRMGAGTVR